MTLLQELFDRVPDPEKDYGADDGADDLAIPLCPEGSACAEQTEQPAADEASEKADDDVPEESGFGFEHKETGKPAGDGSEEQCKNDVHGFGFN